VSISKLPSGRYRAQVWDARAGRNVSVSKVLGGPGTFATKREAKAAREQARERLADNALRQATVAAFRDRWLTDPLFARPKESTVIHNRERTKAFASRYGDLELRQVTDEIVGEWLAGGHNNGTVPALRAMFNDAASAKAGRLVDRNPFAGLGLKRTRGNRDKQPPSEDIVWALIAAAKDIAGPGFSAWLQVACFTGMRPGELDALRWPRVDLERGRIRVVEQWNANSKTWTTPKNGLARDAIITPPAREALLAAPRRTDFVFTTLRDTHFTASSRAYHWKAVRAKAGWDGSLYLATRHFAGWYMVNVLQLQSEDVAIALGHTDGGQLVRQLYGHRETDLALDRVAKAYEGNVIPLRRVDGGAA
jgi:integrase